MTKIQLEIQGLRAIAVLLVLIFHIWPSSISGGYIGVDVFFVISGFLITRIMLREMESTGQLNLGKFYSRRIRRLLPAATTVLIFVLLSYDFFPALYWQSITKEITASVLYYQNWHLAYQAVDYLASENAPGPLQHFWSLSVEEQYYFFWPLICTIVVFLKGPLHISARKLFAFLIITIGFTSLYYSWYLTKTNPGVAYFSTLTRAWQLAAGGALAVFPVWTNLSSRTKDSLGFFGLALIIYAAVMFSKTTPFPGIAAILPTFGATFIIISGPSLNFVSIYSVLKCRPFQYIGDISYSLYLWHWPIIVLYTSNISTDIGGIHGLVILIICFALSHFSRDMIETRLQGNFTSSLYVRKSLVLAITLIVAALVLASYTDNKINQIRKQEISVQPKDTTLSTKELEQKLLKVRDDKADSYRRKCHVNKKQTQPKVCTYGNQKSNKRILLIGDSHAIQWIPTLRILADDFDWRFLSLSKSACVFGDEPVIDNKQRYVSCEKWNKLVMQFIGKFSPQVIVFSQFSRHKAFHSKDSQESAILLADSLERNWRILQKEGIQIVAIKDTPRMSGNIPECLSRNLTEPSSCDNLRKMVIDRPMQPDPLVIAAKKTPGVILVDLTSEFCNKISCFALIDGNIVWRDSHHMTASFARTLSSKFKALIKQSNLLFEDDDTIGRTIFSDDSGITLTKAKSASKDYAKFYGCYARSGEPLARHCSLNKKGDEVFAIVGDDHVRQWLPAIEAFAIKNNKKLVVFGKNKCPIGIEHNSKVLNGDKSCGSWYSNLLNNLEKLKPHYVILSQSLGYRIKEFENWSKNSQLLADNILNFNSFVTQNGAKLLLIADTPRMRVNVPKCVLQNPEFYSINCVTSSADAVTFLVERPDPLRMASEDGNIPIIDLTELICGVDVCSIMDGAVFKYRNRYLLTKSYVLELQNEIENRLRNHLYTP